MINKPAIIKLIQILRKHEAKITKLHRAMGAGFDMDCFGLHGLEDTIMDLCGIPEDTWDDEQIEKRSRFSRDHFSAMINKKRFQPDRFFSDIEEAKNGKIFPPQMSEWIE